MPTPRSPSLPAEDVSGGVAPGALARADGALSVGPDGIRPDERSREASLREQAGWFRSVFEQALVGVALLRGRTLEECVFELANPPFSALWPKGTPLIGRRLLEVVPELEPSIRAFILDALSSGVSGVGEALPHSIDLDGDGVPERYYFNAAHHPLRDANGEISGFVVVGTDVTRPVRARYRAEALAVELRASEARSRIAFRDAPVPMWVFDVDTLRLLDVNAAALRHYGYSYEEFTALTLTDLRTPEEQVRHKDFFGPAQTNDVTELTTRHCTKAGALIDVEVTTQVTTYDGRPARIASIVDVTERLRASEALRLSEERYALAARATSNAIWDWELASGRVTWTEGLTREFGYSRDAIGLEVGWWIESIHPDDRDEVQQSIRTMLRSPEAGSELERHYRFRRADGSWAHVLDRLYVARDDTGTAVRLIGAMEDVTVKHQLDARLRQSQKMEAIGQLAGGIAHDFNNLLTVVAVSLEFVLGDVADDHPIRPDLEQIGAATDRARSLVRQLLTFSRKQPVKPVNVAMGEVVHGMEQLLRRLLGAEINFHVDVDAGTPNVRIDPGQFEQVVMNLVVNARDSMLASGREPAQVGGTLHVEVSPFVCTAPALHGVSAAGDARYARLIVRDTGHGIDEATRAHIFEPFFTTKDVGEGTGLGLATVHGIIAQAGGTIQVDSEVGRGSAFTVLLPAVDGDRSDVTAPPEIPLRATSSGIVLVVEDEAPVRTLLRRALERRQFRVLEARHGADALLLWDTHQSEIDAVLTDVRMPEVGGLAMAQRMRETRPDLPIVFISGYAEDARAAISGSMSRFIDKPFTIDALLRALTELLSSSSRA